VGRGCVNVFLAISDWVYVVKVLQQNESALFCGFSCKSLAGLKTYKSERAIQNSDCTVLRRQQAAAEIQSLFICRVKEQVSQCKVYF